uniref:Chibby 1, beta catenin antagonist n=1 Tax=Myripristis murdjan TaxID=586833 RepID=A0A667XRM7_9TELE
MPLFGNTFSPKKIPPRKSASLSSLHTLDRSTREVELGLEYGSPMMNIGGQSLKFEDGHWILSETTAESHLLEKELEEVKNHHRRKK